MTNQHGPKIVSNGGHAPTINLGRIVTALLAAGALGPATAVLGLPLLGYRVNALADDGKKTAKRVEIVERNIETLDENQRDLMQDAEHANDKLDVILDAMKLPRVPEPKKKKSTLEKLSPE